MEEAEKVVGRGKRQKEAELARVPEKSEEGPSEDTVAVMCTGRCDVACSSCWLADT